MRSRDLEETAPATGLESTPGDYRFPPGTLAGRYVLGERLGAGGMGIVYEAHDARLNRSVALKLLRPDATGGEGAHDQLVREAQTLARLAHPNVVTVHGVGDFEGRFYVEMELVRGCTLAQWLQREARTWQDVLGVFLQAGRGLAAAHAVGIVHRDFKPDNVLVGDDGRVRVADFGIALLGPPRVERDVAPESGMRASEPGSHPGSAGSAGSADKRSHSRSITGAGTPGYMAPEQRGGGGASTRSDQYSFCVALYEALHGVRPRRGRSSGATPEGRDLDPPAWLDEAIDRGLAVSPDERYPELAQLLDILSSEPRRRKRFARTATAIGAGALLLLAGMAWGSAGSRAARLCRGSEAKLAGIWDVDRKASIERTFLASGKPYAADAWHGAKTTLDAYTTEWVTARTEACEATRVRGEQSDQLLGLRMTCLDERLQGVSALAEAFEHADGTVVTHAFVAAQALPPLASCSDPKWLLASVKVPADPKVAAKVADLRARLSRAKALDDLAKYRDALKIASAVSAEAAEIGDLDMQATALYREGKLIGRTGDLAGAEQKLRKAASTADAAGDDAIRVKAIGGLLFFVAGEGQRIDRIAALEQEARAALVRLGGDIDAEANFLMGLGNAYESAGKHEGARAADEKVVDLEVRLHGHESWQEGIALVNLGSTLANNGEVERAIELEQRALGIVSRNLGPSHPSVADAEATIGISLYGQEKAALAEPHMRRAVAITDGMVSAEAFVPYLYGLGDILVAEGKLDEGLAQFQRALDLLSKNHPPDDPILRMSLTGIGEIYVATGRAPDGTKYLERALALPEDGDEGATARGKFALAQALYGTRAGRSRAKGLATEAKATLEKSGSEPGDAKRLRDVDGWLAANR
jgi:tetratricopeptide (TPR) repeat protein